MVEFHVLVRRLVYNVLYRIRPGSKGNITTVEEPVTSSYCGIGNADGFRVKSRGRCCRKGGRLEGVDIICQWAFTILEEASYTCDC